MAEERQLRPWAPNSSVPVDAFEEQKLVYTILSIPKISIHNFKYRNCVKLIFATTLITKFVIGFQNTPLITL